MAATERAGYNDGATPVGVALLDRKELLRVLGRNVGARAHESYALSIQQEEGMAPLRKEVGVLVERFKAPPEAKATVKRNAERSHQEKFPWNPGD